MRRGRTIFGKAVSSIATLWTMRQPLLTLLATCLLGAAGAVGGWYLFAEPASNAREVSGPRTRAVPVETAIARAGHAATHIRATGTLRASDSVVVQPEIAGRVTAVLFEQGQAVAAGTPMIRLAPETLQAELVKAEAALVLARENFQRSEELSRRGATAAQALDEARASLRTAEAEVELARVRLAHTNITAPFDGVVGLKELSVGRYVEPGDELVALERIDPLYLDFRLSERWLTKLAPGEQLDIAVDAMPGRTFPGTVAALDPKVDVNGRAVQLRAAVPNPDRSLRPGLFARVDIEIDERPHAVLIPEAAVVLQERGPVVYRVEDGRAVLTAVSTGMRRDGEVEITQGLAAGATVVVNGHVRLRDQAQVEVVAAAGES
jgi:membrane fusion protein (multidrug efflux system)